MFEPDPRWLQPQAPERATALPAPLYTDPAALEAEKRLVFRQSWQLVAHTGQLQQPGDHIVAEVAGVPLIVVRGDDDALRAFHNVCRHRAGPVAHCNRRAASKLTCRYHGWTYNLDGTLRGAPEMDGTGDFAVDEVRLPEVGVVSWQGLVFVALADAPSFPEVVAGIDDRLAGHRLDELVFSRRDSYEIACNWKVYIDNYLEGYHLPMVHPGLNRLLDYRSYITETHDWHSLQSSPLEETESFWGSGEAFYLFIYPNTMLNVLPGRLQTNRVVPLAPGRCRVDFDYYFPAGSDTDRQRQDIEFSDEVQREDIAICEAVQRGLDSGSYHAGRLNAKRERGVHHFHELLRAAFRSSRRERFQREGMDRG